MRLFGEIPRIGSWSCHGLITINPDPASPDAKSSLVVVVVVVVVVVEMGSRRVAVDSVPAVVGGSYPFEDAQEKSQVECLLSSMARGRTIVNGQQWTIHPELER